MDSDNLLIGAGGLILSALTYFAGVSRERKRQLEDRSWQEQRDSAARADHAREQRIGAVAEEYSQLSHLKGMRIAAGIQGLLKAGVRTLHDDSEIREAVRRIDTRWGPSEHVLGREREQIWQLSDLHAFFSEIDDYHLRNLPEVYNKYGIKNLP